MSTVIMQLIATITLSIFGIWMVILLLSSNNKSKVNVLMSTLIVLGMSFIILDLFALFTAESVALVIERIVYGLAVISAGFLYFFSLNFPKVSKSNRFVSSGVVLYSLLISSLIMFSPLVISGIKYNQWGIEILGGPLELVFELLSLVIIFIVISTNVKKYFKLNGSERRSMRVFLFGLFVFIISELVSVLLFPSIGLANWSYIGDYSIIVFLGLTAFVIVRHGLFDIRLAIVRSVSYVLILVTLAGVYASIAFVFSAVFNRGPASLEQTAIGIISSIFMALLVQPLKYFFDKVTNRIFYKDNYNTDDFFARLNKTLSVTTDLRGLLERVSYEIATTLKADQAFFFIYTTAEGNYITAGTEHHKLLPKVDAILIERLCSGKDDIVLAESLKDNHPVKRMMISHRIELILPLIQDAEVIGFLCLGEHKNSGYTHRDVRTLDTIADELIIAIRNALAVHEIRELNLGLQQKIANATKELRSNNRILKQLDKVKDEFISMASHQLRTPLTSVKGYLSMVLDGDAGKITDSQKQLLNQAFNSSENMVVLINDFLNVSRIQTGKFVIERTPVNMADLVEHEVNVLLPNAKARKMNLVYKKPKDFPITMVDEGKIRQVVMNFSDNAVYYSRENTDINIDLAVEGSNIVFTVKDHGIGVPAKQKDQLFGKFFRADNARVKRPDGTGVGLYLAKKVVDAQGGQIIFDSVEGQGSTFGFKLPIIVPDKPAEPPKSE